MSISSVVAMAIVLTTAINLTAVAANMVLQGDFMNNVSVVEHKIQPGHLGRKAIVYVRQSSERQVRENVESQKLQYAMVEKARSLGWSHVEVIDTDLGCSASTGAKRRDGFERVVTQVSLGEVGIIFSYELSRLSRTDKDWCQLFEICPLVDTLVADEQHVYDLSIADDQLVIGIKGSISVMELRTLRARLVRGQEEKAKRGELIKNLKPGYVLDVDGKVVKDPNKRVQDAIMLVFDRFRAAGTVRQTFKWFHEENVELPVNRFRHGKRTLGWQLPTLAFVRDVLSNPIFAGAYVYGRRTTKTVIENGRVVKRMGAVLAPKQCRVFIPDHHPAYISWDAFEENQRMISRNTIRDAKGETTPAPRSGQGLLMGLLRCGRCGRKLHVRYWGKGGTAGRYLCVGDFPAGGKYCLGFGAVRVDRKIVDEVLNVVSPLGIQASLEAARQYAIQGQERRRAILNQLEQVRYEERRAYEQYNEVDPRNRLVAAELERRWNAKLEDVEALEKRLAQLDAESGELDEGQKRDIMQLGQDFSRVWNSEHCPPELKKRIVRTVIEEIVVDLDDATQTLSFVVHWKGGTHTRIEMFKPPSAKQHKTAQEDLDIIRAMAVRYGDDEIARVLSKLGRKTGKGKRWSEQRVYSARRTYGIDGQKRSTPHPEILNQARAAKHCGVSNTAIERLVSAGVLPMTQLAPFAPWEIRKSDLETSPVREIVQTLRSTGKLVLPGGRGDDSSKQLPLLT